MENVNQAKYQEKTNRGEMKKICCEIKIVKMKIWPKSQPGGGHMIGLENKVNKVSHAGGASSYHNLDQYDEMSEL